MTRFQKLGKRILFTALTALCLTALAIPALAADGASDEVSYTSLVHTRPSSSAMALGRLADGTELTVLDETQNYYKIDCYEMTGYIAKEQVSRSSDDVYRVDCSADAADTRKMASFSMADTLQMRSDIADLSKKQLGTPYVYGGARPGGFDCSGFTSYVYGKNNIRLQRGADDQMQDGIIVPKDSLQVGDLVFFQTYGPWLASHVGIYVGNNQMLHAASQGISYSSLDDAYYANRYVGARRIVNASTDNAQGIGSALESLSGMGRSITGLSGNSLGIRTAG